MQSMQKAARQISSVRRKKPGKSGLNLLLEVFFVTLNKNPVIYSQILGNSFHCPLAFTVQDKLHAVQFKFAIIPVTFFIHFQSPDFYSLRKLAYLPVTFLRVRSHSAFATPANNELVIRKICVVVNLQLFDHQKNRIAQQLAIATAKIPVTVCRIWSIR
jgi:hypothetical protein